MSTDTETGGLTLEDFPEGKVDPAALPEIEVETIVTDLPGSRWVAKDADGNAVVRERWIFDAPGKGKRRGFDVTIGDWAVDGMPWGADNVAAGYRVEPHRIDAFADPEKQAQQVVGLLKAILDGRAKAFAEDGNPKYKALLDQITAAQTAMASEAESEIASFETELSEQIARIFPGFEVKFDPRAEDGAGTGLSFFNASSTLRMGPKDGYKSSIKVQGSGARRTLLWTALRILAGTKFSGKKTTKAKAATGQGYALLIDEPEICLHPNAIREACGVLYDLPASGAWQVMATTHSPAFVDISRDNTTIVRVERRDGGEITGTTVFRPSRVQLTNDERQLLKMANLYDPYVAEFFFGGRSIIVEGDTEYSAFRYVMAYMPDAPKDVHIIRARGKATIVPLMKILNQFGTAYGVLHDSDLPLTKTGKRNGAWTMNDAIMKTAAAAPDPDLVRVIASIKNFESAFLREEVTEEKPYNAIEQLKADPEKCKSIRNLLMALIDSSVAVPPGATMWVDLADLGKQVPGAEPDTKPETTVPR